MTSGFPVVPKVAPVKGCDCTLLPYWASVQLWRERDSSWPQTVYWHLFQSQITASEKVLDKCYQNFIKVGKFSAKTEDI